MRKEIKGCKIVDERSYYISDGYLLTFGDEYDCFVVKHIITKLINGKVVVEENISFKIKRFYSENSHIYRNIDDLVSYAKNELKKRCKYEKNLVIEESIIYSFK